MCIGLSFYLYKNPEPIHIAKNIPFKNLSIVFILNTSSLVITSYILHVIFLDCNIKIKAKDYISLGVITKLLNFTTPFKISPIIKAAYLKKTYRVRLSEFSILFIIQTLITLMTNFFIFLMIVIILITIEENTTKFKAITISISFMIFILYFYATSKEKQKRKKCFLKSNIKIKKTTIAKIVLITTINTIITSMSYYFIIIETSPNIIFYDIYLISNTSDFINNIGVTPGGLGLSELISSLVSKSLQITENEVIAMILINRIIIVVNSLLFLIPSMFYLIRNFKGGNNDIR